LRRPQEWFDSMATNPPVLLRLLYVPMFGLAALLVGERRGWLIGVLAGVVYGGIGLLAAFAPGGLVKWSKAHPKLDNAFLGPLLFFALAYLPHISVWWCAIAGALGSIGGITLGAARRRTLAGRH
jgi:hypothetical protein